MVRRHKIKKKPWNNRREIFLFRAMDNHGELMVEDASAVPKRGCISFKM